MTTVTRVIDGKPVAEKPEPAPRGYRADAHRGKQAACEGRSVRITIIGTRGVVLEHGARSRFLSEAERDCLLELVDGMGSS